MNKKTGIFLVLLLLGGSATIWAFHRKKEEMPPVSPTPPPNPPNTDFSKAVDEAIQQGKSEISLSVEQITEQLHKEMSRTNSDPYVILKFLEPISPEHFQQMQDIFGVRPYSYHTKSEPKRNYLFTDNGIPLTLLDWLKEELSAQEYEQIIKKYKK